MKAKIIAIALVCLLPAVALGQVTPPDTSTGTAKGIPVDPAINGNTTVDDVLRDLDVRATASSILLEESDQSVSIDSINTIQLDETVGFNLTDQGGNVGLMSLDTVPDSAISNTLIIDSDGVIDLGAVNAGAGTLSHEKGGLEADVSAWEGLVGITGGASQEVDTAAELLLRVPDLDASTLPYTPDDAEDFPGTAPTTVKEGLDGIATSRGDLFDLFRDGTVKGTGFDADAQCYRRVNARYDWTADVGGDSCKNIGGTWDCSDWHNTPLVVGGSMYEITCTSTEHTATGRYEPDNACEVNDAGETFLVNAESNFELALQMACPGGTVYRPDGVYVQRGPGFINTGDPQATYNMDGTPDFTGGAVQIPLPNNRYQPGVRMFGWQQDRGVNIVSESRDPDGRYASPDPGNIPYKSGVWVINDHNERSEYLYESATCSGGSRDGLACVHSDVDCPGGGTCGGGIAVHGWLNTHGGKSRNQSGNICSLVDEGSGDYSCDTALTSINTQRGGWMHDGAMHLRTDYTSQSQNMCLSHDTADTVVGDSSMVCDDEPFRTCSPAGGECVVGSVDVGPCISVAEKFLWEEGVKSGRTPIVEFRQNIPCEDGTATCVDSSNGGTYSIVANVAGVDAHCSVTTATACRYDSDCPGGETCEADTCDAGEGLQVWLSSDRSSPRAMPFHSSILQALGDTPAHDVAARVIRKDALAPIEETNTSYTDNNYFDTTVATSQCNGCPETAAGARLVDNAQTASTQRFIEDPDQPSASMKKVAVQYGYAETNSVWDGPGGYFEECSFRNLLFRALDANSSTFERCEFADIENTSNVIGAFNSQVKVIDSTFTGIGSSSLFSIGKKTASLYAIGNRIYDVAAEEGILRQRHGFAYLKENRISGIGRLAVIDPQVENQRGTTVIRDNFVSNGGQYGSTSGFGLSLITISGIAGDSTTDQWRTVIDNNWLEVGSGNNRCFIYFQSAPCPDGSCASPTFDQIGRTKVTVTNNTFRHTDSAAATGAAYCVSAGDDSASTASLLGPDRFQPIQMGNTFDGAGLPSQPIQQMSISDAPSAANGTPGTYYFYDDDGADRCADANADGVLDLSLSAAFTGDDRSLCVLRVDGTWAEF